MATGDNVTLLSKVVSFVTRPVLGRAAAFEAAQTAPEDVDKATMQAMMDRRLHNDVVRKREFELLRQMRKREPQAGNMDLNERTSMFPPSMLSQPDGRAQTIKKIDEIEQQMSQQWWKGKQIKGAFGGSRSVPLADEAPEPSDSGSLVWEPAPDRGAVRAPASAPPAATPGPTSARMEASLYDESQSPAPSEFLATQREEFTADSQIEDAAILFANGHFEGAAQFLLALLGKTELPAEQEQIWMTLFDLFRVTGDRTRFEGAAIDFAARLGRSAPQWGLALEVQQQALAPEIQVASAGQTQRWVSPSLLDAQALAKLKAASSQGSAAWTLDWSPLTWVDDAVLPGMLELFADWCKSKRPLRFEGSQQLDELLAQATSAGRASVLQDWWLWRLSYLRLSRREEDFERVALDYCITYEMSPPAWEAPLCDFRSSERDACDLAFNHSSPLIVGDELLNTLAARSSRATPAEPAQAPSTSAVPRTEDSFAVVELSAELLGNATAALAILDGARGDLSKLVIDCRNLVRVDFLAAGDLLNWAAARNAEGCKVEFKNLNRLVATFFAVIGIDEFVRIIPPVH